uniref:Reverse transcriptase zinc-binding domain-containing protein n=1 Tax=Fagus sylvatica TaxID=28930 RepID=A0A2N9I1F5_FAGSY
MKITVLQEAWCDQCEKAVEDVLHTTWGCPVISHVWMKESWTTRYKQDFGTFGDLFGKILVDEEDDDVCCFAILSWALWTKRNKARLSSATSANDDIHQWATNLWTEYHQAKSSLAQIKPPR